MLTTDYSEAADSMGRRGVSRNLVHSRLSFSFRARRCSKMGWPRAASRDMAATGKVRLMSIDDPSPHPPILSFPALPCE